MLVLIAGLGLTFVSNLGFKTLEESVITTKADELSLEFSEFRESEGKLVFTAKNKADISADFIINVSVKTKSLIPFMGKEMKGVSDIIALEPDMSGEVVAYQGAERLKNANEMLAKNPFLEYNVTFEDHGEDGVSFKVMDVMKIDTSFITKIGELLEDYLK